MLVMPRTAVKVSHPRTNKLLIMLSTVVKASRFRWACCPSEALKWFDSKDAMCSATRRSQNVRRTVGTLRRIHSVSTNVDRPKLLRRLRACWKPPYTVWTTVRALHHRTNLTSASGSNAANTGACCRIDVGNGRITKMEGAMKLTGSSFWTSG
jgi:hypothetical protein